MNKYLKKIYSLLTKKDKRLLSILFLFTILISVIETIGISAIMPFISIASNPDLINNAKYKEVFDFFKFQNKNDFVITFGFALIGFYVFRAFLNLLYSYMLNKFAFGNYHQFAFKLFTGYVGLPYKEFTNRNTAVLTKTIINEAANLTLIIQYMLMFLSEFFTVIFIYIMLFLVNWKMTLALSLILTIKVIFLTKILAKIIKVQGEKRSVLQEKFYRIISETFSNFKMVKLLGNEKVIFESFAESSRGYSKANIINSTVGTIPRNVLETIGFSSLIAIVIYILYTYKSAAFVIPIISMYALGLYRMLPAINRMMSNYNGILFLHTSLDIVHSDLMYDTEGEGNEKINFTTQIDIHNIDFNYNDATNVLKNINLSIKKGERIAFVGPSGSGKSTLIDLIIGIYKPCKGQITVDGKILDINNVKSWRAKIGYIPQSIYLFDGTVAENVSFGKEVDEFKITDCLKKANVWDFLISKNGIYTKVGEGGIQLSGGQKQRIGIARALYGDPEILVLDEATSALDNETEAQIMQEIYKMSENKTLLIIAHRLSTIERCQRVIDLQNF